MIIGTAIAATRGGFNGNTINETAQSQAKTLVSWTKQLQDTVQILLANGCLDTQLDFYAPAYGIAANPSAPSDGSCKVFNNPNAFSFPASTFPFIASSGGYGPVLFIVQNIGSGLPMLGFNIYGVDYATALAFNNLVGAPNQKSGNSFAVPWGQSDVNYIYGDMTDGHCPGNFNTCTPTAMTMVPGQNVFAICNSDRFSNCGQRGLFSILVVLEIR